MEYDTKLDSIDQAQVNDGEQKVLNLFIYLFFPHVNQTSY